MLAPNFVDTCFSHLPNNNLAAAVFYYARAKHGPHCNGYYARLAVYNASI